MAVDTLQRLLEKRNAVNTRIRKEQSKRKASDRKNETRRKILAGAAVLEKAAKDNDFSTMLMAELKRFLVRDSDRALFGLAPKVSKEK